MANKTKNFFGCVLDVTFFFLSLMLNDKRSIDLETLTRTFKRLSMKNSNFM